MCTQPIYAVAELLGLQVAEEDSQAQMEGRRRAESKANAERAKREAVELEMAAEQQRVSEEQHAEAPPVHAGAFTQIVEGFGDSEEVPPCAHAVSLSNSLALHVSHPHMITFALTSVTFSPSVNTSHQ